MSASIPRGGGKGKRKKKVVPATVAAVGNVAVKTSSLICRRKGKDGKPAP